MPIWAGWVAGAVAGFTSFVSHAGGPPAAVYMLSQRLSKTQFQATTVLLFWVINIVKFLPFALLGAWLGVKAHHLVPEWLFFRITYVLLVVTGSKLIWDALT